MNLFDLFALTGGVDQKTFLGPSFPCSPSVVVGTCHSQNCASRWWGKGVVGVGVGAFSHLSFSSLTHRLLSVEVGACYLQNCASRWWGDWGGMGDGVVELGAFPHSTYP